MYLLDSNACIGLLNNSSPTLVKRLRRHSLDEITLCSVVKAELIYAAYHSGRMAHNLRLLERFFSPFYSYPFDDGCVATAGRIRAQEIP